MTNKELYLEQFYDEHYIEPRCDEDYDVELIDLFKCYPELYHHV